MVGVRKEVVTYGFPMPTSHLFCFLKRIMQAKLITPSRVGLAIYFKSVETEKVEVFWIDMQLFVCQIIKLNPDFQAC